MTVCRKCGTEMKAGNEIMSGFSFQTKVWNCTQCGFNKNVLTKDETDLWEKKFAEQMKNKKEDECNKYNKGFDCLKKGNDKGYIGKKFKPEKYECKCNSGSGDKDGCGGSCGGCKCH